MLLLLHQVVAAEATLTAVGGGAGAASLAALAAATLGGVASRAGQKRPLDGKRPGLLLRGSRYSQLEHQYSQLLTGGTRQVTRRPRARRPRARRSHCRARRPHTTKLASGTTGSRPGSCAAAAASVGGSAGVAGISWSPGARRSHRPVFRMGGQRVRHGTAVLTVAVGVRVDDAASRRYAVLHGLGPLRNLRPEPRREPAQVRAASPHPCSERVAVAVQCSAVQGSAVRCSAVRLSRSHSLCLRRSVSVLSQQWPQSPVQDA